MHQELEGENRAEIADCDTAKTSTKTGQKFQSWQSNLQLHLRSSSISINAFSFFLSFFLFVLFRLFLLLDEESHQSHEMSPLRTTRMRTKEEINFDLKPFSCVIWLNRAIAYPKVRFW